MKLDEFIAGVLHDINSGLMNARGKTGRRYFVDTSQNKGVSFDIAIAAGSSTGKHAEGAAKAGFIDVLGANVGAKVDEKKENSEVSRIQFTINFPFQTEEEEKESWRALRANNQNSIIDPYE